MWGTTSVKRWVYLRKGPIQGGRGGGGGGGGGGEERSMVCLF